MNIKELEKLRNRAYRAEDKIDNMSGAIDAVSEALRYLPGDVRLKAALADLRADRRVAEVEFNAAWKEFGKAERAFEKERNR